MPNVDISTLEIGGGNFEPAEAGPHHAVITEAEWTKSKKSDKDMLEVTWELDDEEDEDAGKQVKDFVVLTYHDKKRDAEVLHWNIPRYFGLAGLWPAKAAERTKLFAGANAAKTYDKVAKQLVGKSGTLTLIVEEGRDRLDDNGNPTGEKYGAQNRIDKYKFDDVKRAKASSVSF